MLAGRSKATRGTQTISTHAGPRGAAAKEIVAAWAVLVLAIVAVAWQGRAEARIFVPFPPPSPIGWSAKAVIQHYGQPWKVLSGKRAREEAGGAVEEIILYGSEFGAAETQCNQGTMIFYLRGERVVQARYVYPVCWGNPDTLPLFRDIAVPNPTEVDCSELVRSPDGRVRDCKWRSFQWNSKSVRWTAGVVSSPIPAYSQKAHAMAWRKRERAEYPIWTLTVRDVEAMEAGGGQRAKVGSGPAGEGPATGASKESEAHVQTEVPHCPKGTRLAGARPPQGSEQWCEHRGPVGNAIVRHGPQWVWFDNGQLNSRYEYKEGDLEGPWTEWYPNGQKRAEGRYWFGHKAGLQTEWLSDGTKKTELRFNLGDMANNVYDGRPESWKICDDPEWPVLHLLLVDYCKQQPGGCGGLPQLAEKCKDMFGKEVSGMIGAQQTELNAHLFIVFEETVLLRRSAWIQWERRRDEWRLDKISYRDDEKPVDLSPAVLAWLKAIKTDGVKTETIRPLLGDEGIKIGTKVFRPDEVLKELAPANHGKVRRAFEILAGILLGVQDVEQISKGCNCVVVVANGVKVSLASGNACDLVFLGEAGAERLVQIDCSEIDAE